MANDAVFRASLVWLAAVIVVVGVCTQSFKKMMYTYVVGVLGISGCSCPIGVTLTETFRGGRLRFQPRKEPLKLLKDLG
ncbi:peptidase [Prunus dulcis]|uniref:Peptidase n=1 Tax=Prunus dulcis TaxID=3755 RepID=A0A4Y1QV64_PRUDU|nr:peptidase [Prunus dulcis]